MTDAKILKQIMTQLTVPLWPTAGKALGIGRNSTFEGARRGEIKTVQVGRRRPVPTAWLRRQLDLDGPAPRSRKSA
jgi:hypothetical protein